MTKGGRVTVGCTGGLLEIAFNVWDDIYTGALSLGVIGKVSNDIPAFEEKMLVQAG